MAKKKPADEPAKQSQLAAIRDVVAEVGWAGALLFNSRTNRLIDGHARKELFEGKGPVPVLVGDWDEAAEAKILATLDPIGALAMADAAKLGDLLRDVGTGSEALQMMLSGLAEKAGVIPGEKGVNDVNDVYKGMPEFEQDDLTAAYSLRVNFDTLDDSHHIDMAPLQGADRWQRVRRCRRGRRR